MKKFLLLSLSLVLVLACGQSPQKKADALIKESLLKTLIFPDSYEAVETVLDSAFTPYQDPSFISTVLEICNKGPEVADLEDKMKRAKSSMAIWNHSYMGAYGRNEYSEAKNEYDQAKASYDAIVSRVQKMSEGLRVQIEKEPEFIGFQARHRYRAKNNAGNTLIDDSFFLLDKDLSKVVAQWNEDEMGMYKEFLRQVSEAAQANQ